MNENIRKVQIESGERFPEAIGKDVRSQPIFPGDRVAWFSKVSDALRWAVLR
jgi:hypothetical protein